MKKTYQEFIDACVLRADYTSIISEKEYNIIMDKLNEDGFL